MKSAELQRYANQQMTAYRECTDDRCEVSSILRKCDHFRKWEQNHCLPGLAIHHIAGRSNAESQAFCNLILVSTAAHEWNHQSGGLSYNITHAFEAVCLLAKWRRHYSLDGCTFAIDIPADQCHWDIPALDAVRAKCVSHKTIRDRVEFLEESLRGSPFESLAADLLEKVA